jgi:hypothetical protein
MASVRFSARLDTPHHGPSHRLKVAGVVAGTLAGIHNALVKSSSTSTGAAYTRVFTCPHGYKSRGFKSGERGDHAVGSALPFYHSRCVLLGTSRTARLKCAGAPSCIPYSCSDCQWYILHQLWQIL